MVVEVIDLDQNRPLMLLPMARVERRTYSAIEGLDFGVSDYIAPLLAPGAAFTPDEAREVWRSIKSVLPRADLLRLSRIPRQIFNAANPLVSLSSSRPMETAAFGVHVQGDPNTLIQRLCRKSTFRDLAKFRRRLERRGKILLKVPESLAEVDGILDAMIAQRRQRFREIGRSDLLASDRIVAFYRAAAHQGLKGGPVRIFGLFVNEQCAGTAYGLVHRGAFHLLIQTMDGSEELRNCSPGLQVTAEVMKWSLQQGLTYFDFTIGNLPYKTEFGAAASALYELDEAQTTRGHIVLGLARAATACKAWVRQHPWLFALLRGPWHTMRRQLTGMHLTANTERP
jgi:CelD/BcsL family acetyltransferase involved in cellulose biosynthesis